MFEGKVWTVLCYPWKCWHDMMVSIGDVDGQERVVNVDHLTEAEDFGGGCNGDSCEIKRKKG